MKVLIRLVFIFLIFSMVDVKNAYSIDDFGAFKLIKGAPVPSVYNEYSIEKRKPNMRDLFYEKSSVNEILSFQNWKADLTLTKIDPIHPYKEWLRRHSAKVGKVIACVGKCYIQRGAGKLRAKKRSIIYEGDHIDTQETGHLWIFLVDGTIVRLSPNSSISITELKVSEAEVFLLSRLNYGNIYWRTREDSKFLAPTSNRETDDIFLPLLNFEEIGTLYELGGENLFNSLKENDFRYVSLKYEYLNKLLSSNKSVFTSKKHSHLVIFPHGSLEFNDFRGEFLINWKGRSFLRVENFIDVNNSEDENNFRTGGRGYEKENLMEGSYGKWYGIDDNGKEIEESSSANKYGWVGSFITSNIPSILLYREKYLDELSREIFLGDEGFLEEQKFFMVQSDLVKRKKFLKEYSRRNETTTLSYRNRYLEETKFKEDFSWLNYAKGYFSMALSSYRDTGEVGKGLSLLRENEKFVFSNYQRFIRSNKRRKEKLIDRNKNGINK